MFGKRSIQMRFVKDKKDDNSTPTMAEAVGESSARIIEDLAKDLLKYTAATIVGVIVTIKAVDTLSQIAVKKTKSADNK